MARKSQEAMEAFFKIYLRLPLAQPDYNTGTKKTHAYIQRK